MFYYVRYFALVIFFSERHLLFTLWQQEQPVPQLVHGFEDGSSHMLNPVHDFIHPPLDSDDLQVRAAQEDP